MKEQLREHNIAYLEANGDFYPNQGQTWIQIDHVQTDNPNLDNPVERTLANYHSRDNLPTVAPEISGDESVRFFYLTKTSTTPTPSIDVRYFDQEIVKSYGPFYNTGGGEVAKGAMYINFYKPIPKKN